MAVGTAVRHFERASAGYANLRSSGLLGRLRRQEQEDFQALAPVAAGELVLDAGCGDGETLRWLRARGARAVGVDVAHGMASLCRRASFDVCVQDMERLGVRGVFDWVLCIGSLEFTAEPQRAVDGFAAALRAGGRLVLLYPRRGWLGLLYAAYHRTHGVPIRLFDHRGVLRLFSNAGLRALPGRRDAALSSVCVAERPR
jgi:SAM-dependent methyltransferase